MNNYIQKKNKIKDLPKGMVLIFTLVMLLLMLVLATAVIGSSMFAINVSSNQYNTSEAFINADTTYNFMVRTALLHNTDLIGDAENGLTSVGEFCDDSFTKTKFSVAWKVNSLGSGPVQGPNYAEQLVDQIEQLSNLPDFRYENVLFVNKRWNESGALPVNSGTVDYYNWGASFVYQNVFDFPTSHDVECASASGSHDAIDVGKGGYYFPSTYLGNATFNFNRRSPIDVSGVSIMEGDSSKNEYKAGANVEIIGITSAAGFSGANAPSRDIDFAGSGTATINNEVVFPFPNVLITGFYTKIR